MVKYKAETMEHIHFGKYPSADFKLGWILGHAASQCEEEGPEVVEKAVLQAVGAWYDSVFGWDCSVPKREPDMVKLAHAIVTMGDPLEPSEITDPVLFGQARNDHH